MNLTLIEVHVLALLGATTVAGTVLIASLVRAAVRNRRGSARTEVTA